ncbi:MAG: hypothetical protein QOJ58_5255, partial [Alphaproteobacteria bacterium]|nr:hypothetical protein [Alphaproteobacteria bacterium]
MKVLAVLVNRTTKNTKVHEETCLALILIVAWLIEKLSVRDDRAGT